MGRAGEDAIGPPATETTGEGELLERLRRGDGAAAAEFYDRYARRIHRYILQVLGGSRDADADDLLHDTFIALAESLPYFRAQSSLFTFACAIAHRKVASFLRDLARRERHVVPHETISAPSEERAHVREMLDRIPAADRELLFLKYVEEMSVNEITRVLGSSEHAVESRLARARRRLAGALREVP